MGRKYKWILPTRGELQWLSDHPPLHLLSEERIWVPSCRSDWGGVYDRHAALPRRYADAYLSRHYELSNSSEKIVDDIDAQEVIHNAESYLAFVLRRGPTRSPR
jgi:hypothetical protein